MGDPRNGAGERARRVLITGASSGVGRATAHRLAGEGARLVLASRSQDVLEEVADECRARGARDVLVCATDVGEREAVERLFAEAESRYGGLDAVIHSAAVVAYGRFQDVPAEVFDRAVRTNFIGTANVARCALLMFDRAGGGSLVLVGSVLGKIVTPLMSSYCATKWGAYGLARVLQIEARTSPDVHVSVVSPGSVNTPIYDQAASYSGHGGTPPPPIVSADRVAARCVDAIDRPRRDRNVGIFNAVMVAGYRLAPPLFDRMVSPLLTTFGLGRAEVAPNPGNVLVPNADGEAVAGRWPHFWG
ncbi:Short-chain dehydrogenase [Nocardioides terrae]|uniref:Short-chain dehydrogenase n=1 Tax=Nocardioides terrae TaxID=574651 RepID=A0A1I1DPM8_9ACTN|nr:SDR family NAD(P)-dependent oxidoreductase [Nocardioides terrae]SFB76915.1 Short-chain dehydrogenase [Nocardioides terrae]